MKLFTLGPVSMDRETLDLGLQQLPYFRDDGFTAVNLEITRLLKNFLRTDVSTRLAMLSTSGTGAMEAAVSQTFTQSDRLLIINGGTFGQRFVDICKLYKIPHDVLSVSPEEGFSEHLLAPYEDECYTGVLINIHETSIGRLYPIDIVSRFAKRHAATLVVDAIGSFMADTYEMDNWGADISIFSSHKGLSVAPGISFVAINEQTWSEKVERNPQVSYYMDLRSHVQQMDRGQTPYTPSVSVIVQLYDKLSRIESFGLDGFLSNVRELAEYFRDGLTNLPLHLPSYTVSNALTPILLPKDNAKAVYSSLRDQYGIMINPCSGDFAANMLRVGHIGALSTQDYDVLLDALSRLLREPYVQ